MVCEGAVEVYQEGCELLYRIGLAWNLAYRTLRHQDISAPRQFGINRMVPKCLETIRHQIFTGAELSGHFGTSAEIPRDTLAPYVKNT